MSEHQEEHAREGFHGPKCWVIALVAGLILGSILSFVLPAVRAYTPDEIAAKKGVDKDELEQKLEEKIREHEAKKDEDHHGHAPVALKDIKAPDIPLYLAIPFLTLLILIAVMPLKAPHFWEHHFPDFAFFLGGIVVAYYLIALGDYTTVKGEAGYGAHKMMHVGMEYFQFIALVGSLYVVTGGILVDIKGRGVPIINTLILAIGGVIANIIGTTGAAALLIRSYIRINKHRISPFHIVLFIFIVANCGGCLTPIGDPPLFLGYLQGIDFTWTLKNCLSAWAVCLIMLLALFYLMDVLAIRRYEAREGKSKGEKMTIRITGLTNFFFLGVVLFGVFLDKIINDALGTHYHGIGAVLQIIAATVAYKTSKRENLEANEFSFAPIEEVGFLFIGLFATMVPALDYLGNNAASLGIDTPTEFYWATGALSAFLDNAPTYLNFLSAAHGLGGLEMGFADDKTLAWMQLATVGETGYSPAQLLLAISLGAVFFGAATYIGNAPNFMVKAIAESSGVRMPSFFGYIVKYSLPLLVFLVLPIVWIIFVL